MPFVTLDQIKTLIPKGVHVQLNTTLVPATEGPESTPAVLYFDSIENEAAKIIRDKTGRAIPSDVDDAPDWVTLPAARIITKLTYPLLQGVEPNSIEQVQKDYEEALEMLAAHPVTDATTGEEILVDKSTSTVADIDYLTSF